MNELTIKEFYMIPDDNKIISRKELNALSTLPTSTYYIIKTIKTNNIVLYTAIKHTGLPPEPIPITFNDFKDALELANKHSYEELMKMANDGGTERNIIEKIKYLGIHKHHLPRNVKNILKMQQGLANLNKNNDFNDVNSYAINTAKDELLTDPDGHMEKIRKLIDDAAEARHARIKKFKENVEKNYKGNDTILSDSIKTAAAKAVVAATAAAATKKAVISINIDPKYTIIAEDLLNKAKRYAYVAQYAAQYIEKYGSNFRKSNKNELTLAIKAKIAAKDAEIDTEEAKKAPKSDTNIQQITKIPNTSIPSNEFQELEGMNKNKANQFKELQKKKNDIIAKLSTNNLNRQTKEEYRQKLIAVNRKLKLLLPTEGGRRKTHRKYRKTNLTHKSKKINIKSLRVAKY